MCVVRVMVGIAATAIHQHHTYSSGWYPACLGTCWHSFFIRNQHQLATILCRCPAETVPPVSKHRRRADDGRWRHRIDQRPLDGRWWSRITPTTLYLRVRGDNILWIEYAHIPARGISSLASYNFTFIIIHFKYGELKSSILNTRLLPYFWGFVS